MTDPVHMRPKLVGARVKRTEDPRLLAGRGNFVDDRQVANALHVAFRRSDHPHARIVAIDTAKARAAYQDFLTLWKAADSEIPILKPAKTESAGLK